ncbi:phytanoyl-CoA dioxygenase family protein [Acidobacteria bacterium AB60]|nr:phytanoyl-CoA dioxygenase family protein [Acidobacteria bacterium AB60]
MVDWPEERRLDVSCVSAREDTCLRLRREGVVVLRGVVETGFVGRLRAAAERCFAAMEAEGTDGEALRQRCGFNRFSHSALAAALLEFGCMGLAELLAPLSEPRIAEVITEAMGAGWSCWREQSWVRKKRSPMAEGKHGQAYQGWHQDGALGVRFPAEPGAEPPMTALLTCWIPLHACGVECPGLEFVRRSLKGLLHFTELDDAGLRRRFEAEDFWAPQLEAGDALIFLNGTLHRTYATVGMRWDRVSVEYRITGNREQGTGNRE